jgi:hypothetical protein
MLINCGVLVERWVINKVPIWNEGDMENRYAKGIWKADMERRDMERRKKP